MAVLVGTLVAPAAGAAPTVDGASGDWIAILWLVPVEMAPTPLSPGT